MKRFHTILVLAAVVASTIGCAKKDTGQAGAPAQTGGESSTPEMGQPAGEPAHGTGGGTEEAVAPAGSATGIWAQIDAESAKLEAVIGSGSLAKVHLHAFVIRDLVAALPAVSQGMVAADRERLEKGVKAVAKEAADLDTAGDAGDMDATQRAHTAMAASLKDVRSVTRDVK